MAKLVKKTKTKKEVKKATVYIKSSFNNTILSAVDESGGVFCWSSTGNAGFKGSKKSTPYAASQAARILIDKMKEFNVAEIGINIAGVSSGRDAAARAFGPAGFKINFIKDKTSIPHNGCRPKKARRV
jgi:small subunit ribosomal protein S11